MPGAAPVPGDGQVPAAAQSSYCASEARGASATHAEASRWYCAAASRWAPSAADRRAASRAYRRTAAPSPAPSAWWASTAGSVLPMSRSTASTRAYSSLLRCGAIASSTAIRTSSCRNRSELASAVRRPVLRQSSSSAADPPRADASTSRSVLVPMTATACKASRTLGGGKELRPADWIGVAVLPVQQVLVHDRPEVRIIQPPSVQSVEQRGKPADRHGQQAAAWP